MYPMYRNLITSVRRVIDARILCAQLVMAVVRCVRNSPQCVVMIDEPRERHHSRTQHVYASCHVRSALGIVITS